MHYLGIDIGSSYLKLWRQDDDGHTILARNFHHHGDPRRALLSELGTDDAGRARLLFSGALPGDELKAWRHEGLLAEIDYLKTIHPRRRLLIIGAEKIECVHFDDAGRIVSYVTNQACAAGTGSFLDEQLKRLGLSFSDLERIPLDEQAPLVASRCAVFAKTDLIHLQQAGHTPEALYNGLCQGLVITGLKSVFGGRIPEGQDFIISGGLLANPHIRHFIAARMPRAVLVENPGFSRAVGLSRKASLHGQDAAGFRRTLMESAPPVCGAEAGGALTLTRSIFPSQELERRLDAFGNEVWHTLVPGENLQACLGVDIGSTSTKAVLVDDRDTIRLDLYTRTSGDPIAATRRIFQGIQALVRSLGLNLTIKASSTTGSGRTLVGAIIGADLVMNEISAHGAGALAIDPGVETIFEIGGQDAKFIRLSGGRVVDVNMNYVCAAGTGSFIEEQAGTLGMALSEIGERVMGVTPLANSDRCTVFMNQEVTRQIAAGHSKERIMAGVLLAVFKNYIHRVVGPRPYSRERIVFQGATARNQGLVAALEHLTGAVVAVSPFCHVMGAYGAALLAKARVKGTTTFKGFDLPEIRVSETHCRLCENTCRLTVAERDGEKITWGYMCGKEGGKRTGRKPNPAMEVVPALLKRFQTPNPAAKTRFKMPALGLNEGFAPFWQVLSQDLGIDIELCYPTDAAIRQELSHIGTGEFCYPIKVAMAATQVILKEHPGEKVLLPFLIKEAKDPTISPRSLYCPFITAMPGFYHSEVYSLTVDFSVSARVQAKELERFMLLAGLEAVPVRRLVRTVLQGRRALRDARQAVLTQGREILDTITPDEKVIVLLGRPYNLYHRILNLGIPELIESLGYRVIPMDILPDEATNADVTARFPDMYWYQGQRILKKALTIRKHPSFFPVLLSNFSCGPDSFILSYFEEIFRDKPYLILELDEHGSATGYQTRIEAFLDMVAHATATSGTGVAVPRSRIRYDMAGMRGKRLWIPQIHPYIPDLWAAMLKHHGYETQALGTESQAHCDLGRSFCRGSECLPAALTIGKFIDNVKDSPHEDVLIMPRANGPCRYGQYATLHSRILERVGLEKAQILSPTSEDGYAFFTPEITRAAWKTACIGDMLYKLRCRSVPYHTNRDLAERLFDTALTDLCHLIAQGRDWQGYVHNLVRLLKKEIDYTQPRKPLVGIVGEIFVRLNRFSNQNITQVIEAAGAEAWLSPMSEWCLYVAELLTQSTGLWAKMRAIPYRAYLHHIEDTTLKRFAPLLFGLKEPPMRSVLKEGTRFLPMDFEGESILTLGRAKLFAEMGASLIVNCAPFGCMPGRITAYFFQNNPHVFTAPIVNLFFDGTGDNVSRVRLYLESIVQDQNERQGPRPVVRRIVFPATALRAKPDDQWTPGERRPEA